MLFQWIKVLHIVSVMAWMAALLYLPRLFVYHSTAPIGSEPSETFKIMERRLARAIMTPAMLASWLFGVWLVILAGWWSAPWLHAKLFFVVAMTVVHGFLMRHTRGFAEDKRVYSSRFWRILNEIPTILMILVVILVVVKQF